MHDLNKDALGVWNALKPMIDDEIKERTRGAVQRRKAKVTTAPSLTTNTIGVTEAFGPEMFIPFVSNLASATVGDYVWIEYMYDASNSFASMFASADDKDKTVAGNLTVGGVLDTAQRRCYATLSSSGWHRVLVFEADSHNQANGYAGMEIGLSIGTTGANNERHDVKFFLISGHIGFLDETSCSKAMYITKIRYTENNGIGNIDIWCDSTSVSAAVDFIVYCNPTKQYQVAPAGLIAVDNSPSGETIKAEYAFVDNTPNRRSYAGKISGYDSISCPYKVCATVKAARASSMTTLIVDAIADSWDGVAYSSRNDNRATVSVADGVGTLTNFTNNAMNYIIETF